MTAGGSSALAGLPSYWDVAKCPPKVEWEKWWDLFVMAVNTKYSTSVPELTRVPTEQQSGQPALLNNLNERATEEKHQHLIPIIGVSRIEKPHRQVPVHGGGDSHIERKGRKL